MAFKRSAVRSRLAPPYFPNTTARWQSPVRGFVVSKLRASLGDGTKWGRGTCCLRPAPHLTAARARNVDLCMAATTQQTQQAGKKEKSAERRAAEKMRDKSNGFCHGAKSDEARHACQDKA